MLKARMRDRVPARARRQRHTSEPSARPRLRWFDLASEVTVSLTARPARTLLTALGTVLGVAALVATLGLAGTAGHQILSRFDELAATEVRVVPTESASSSGEMAGSTIPFDSDDRLGRLNGVVSAGSYAKVSVANDLVRSIPINDPRQQSEHDIPVVAASAGLFDAVRAEVRSGRTFDVGHDQRSDPVAVLGPGAAWRLNVHHVATTPAVFIGDQPLTVVGVLDNVQRAPELLNAVIVPHGLARLRYDLAAPGEVVIETEIGAADLIGSQAPTALSPNAPDRLRAMVPPSMTRARGSVESDVNGLLLVLGLISLVVGAVGIANVTLVSVLERTGEIGLRRALGATRRHIALQFLAESCAVGTIAGMLGTSLGIITVVNVSFSRQWTPVVSPWLPAVAPLAGTVVGLLAGTYPAWKAGRLEPISALRAG